MSADWAMRWIGSDATFAERLVAFAAVEVSSHLHRDSSVELSPISTCTNNPTLFSSTSSCTFITCLSKPGREFLKGL